MDVKRRKPKKLINFQDNEMVRVLPFTEWLWNVHFVSIHEINNYNDRIIYNEEEERLSHQISFTPELIEGFTMSKDRKRIKMLLDELVSIRIDESTEDEDKVRSFYDYASWNHKEKRFVIGMNPKYIPRFRSLKKNFTRFFMTEGILIKSTFGKPLYMILSEKAHKGSWIVSVKDFKKEMALPENFITRHIETKIIKPLYTSVNERNNFSFDYRIIKKKVGKTYRIDKFVFENIKNHDMPDIADMVISLKPEQLFERMKKEVLEYLEEKKDSKAVYFYRHLIFNERTLNTKILDENKNPEGVLGLVYIGTIEDVSKFSDYLEKFEYQHNRIIKHVFKKYFPNHKLNFSIKSELDEKNGQRVDMTVKCEALKKDVQAMITKHGDKVILEMFELMTMEVIEEGGRYQLLLDWIGEENDNLLSDNIEGFEKKYTEYLLHRASHYFPEANLVGGSLTRKYYAKYKP